MNLKNNFLLKFDKLLKEKNLHIYVFIFLGILSLFVFIFNNNQKSQLINESENHSVDTYIPKGFVLVPIEILNADSLQSIIGRTGGVVDLYLPLENKKSIKIASKVKLLKGPLNPNEFAVLIKEADSPQLLSYTGPFIAAIQNPNEKKSEVFKQSQKQQVRIEYYN